MCLSVYAIGESAYYCDIAYSLRYLADKVVGEFPAVCCHIAGAYHSYEFLRVEICLASAIKYRRGVFALSEAVWILFVEDEIGRYIVFLDKLSLCFGTS